MGNSGVDGTAAARAVTAALAGVSGAELLGAVSTLEQRWRAELEATQARARSLHGEMLDERRALQRALGSASHVFSTLAPARSGTADAAGDQQDTAVALSNASKTLTLLGFFERAPEALHAAREELRKVVGDDARTARAGNASKLCEVHAVVLAVERLRDVAQLEGSDISAVMGELKAVDELRADVERFLMADVFSDMLQVAKSNPRLLVAAMRIVKAEERRDAWWKRYVAAHGLHTGAGGAPRKKRVQGLRPFDAVALCVERNFHGLHHDLLTKRLPHQDGASQVSRILLWLDERVADGEQVVRYVAPCVPTEMMVVDFYIRRLHEWMMKTLCMLLQATTDMRHEEHQAVLSILSWYAALRTAKAPCGVHLDQHLDDGDRRRLVGLMRTHVARTVGDQIQRVVKSIDARNPLPSTTPSPLLTSIDDLVKYASTLGIPAVRKAIAVGITEALRALQSQFELLLAVGEEPLAATRPSFVCSIANTMADLLEYVDNLRDTLTADMDEESRAEVASAVEACAQRFKALAVSAINDLTRHVERSVGALLANLFGPSTGTDVMLDVVGTMDDVLATLRDDLIKEHYEHLVHECLRCVVAHYIAPFLALSEAGGGGRLGSTRSEYVTRPMKENVHSTRKSMDRIERHPRKARRAAPGRGLLVMNATAVVAQIDKDEDNMRRLLVARAEAPLRRQLAQAMEPLGRLRAMYTCTPTPVDLVRTYDEAKTCIAASMAALGASCGPPRRALNVRAAEAIWGARADVNTAVKEEAVMSANMGGVGGVAVQRRKAAPLSSLGRSTFSLESSGGGARAFAPQGQ